MIPERGITIKPYDQWEEPRDRLRQYLLQEWAEEILACMSLPPADVAIELLKEYKSIKHNLGKSQ